MFANKYLDLFMVIVVVIALNAGHCLCDNHNNAIVDQNSTSTASYNETSIDAIKPKTYLHRIHITNGFIYRSLFVVMVIAMSVSLICILRMYCMGRSGRRRQKSSKDLPKYDSLPTTAINESLPKNAFVLNDSEDEEMTLYDSSHHLMNR